MFETSHVHVCNDNWTNNWFIFTLKCAKFVQILFYFTFIHLYSDNVYTINDAIFILTLPIG
jgi:hypothetical protein